MDTSCHHGLIRDIDLWTAGKLKSCTVTAGKPQNPSAPISDPLGKGKAGALHILSTAAHPQGFTHSVTRAETQTCTKAHKTSAFPKILCISDFVCCKLTLWPPLILPHPSEISAATSGVFAERHLQHQKGLLKMLLPSDRTVFAITLNEILICTSRDSHAPVCG